MKLSEYQAKSILREYGIAIPRGNLVDSAGEAEVAAREIGKPVVLKAQVLVAGRGKAGGIIFVDDIDKVKKVADELIGTTIKGSLVGSLLVEEKLTIGEQYYASLTIDRQTRSYTVLVSREGGVDIEETAQKSPSKIARYRVSPDNGLNQSEVEEMLSSLGFDNDSITRLAGIIGILYTVAIDNDTELVELNPLVKTESGELVAADARMIIDDNALFRHPELTGSTSADADDTPLEVEARKLGLDYVDLSGDIGVVGNGAGLVMATLDVIDHFGGKPANFLDIGGGGSLGTPKRGVLLVMSKPAVRAVLVNILGGITRCDIVAQAVIEALAEAPEKKPVVVRMMGTNEAEGNRMLKEVGIDSYPNMEAAIQAILEI